MHLWNTGAVEHMRNLGGILRQSVAPQCDKKSKPPNPTPAAENPEN